MAKKMKIVIKAKDIKVSTGHRQHTTGTGAHDNRPRRQRTRTAEKKAAIRNFSY
jgi:hypothetical protein